MSERIDAWLNAQAIHDTFEGYSADEIERLPLAEYSRLRQRAGLAPVEAPFTPAPAPPAREPHFTETVESPEPVGLDPDSPEFFHAWRSQRVSGGAGKGIFDSVPSQSDAYRAATARQSGRTAYSNANVVEPPKLEGRQERQGDMRDTRTLAQRFGSPSNAFNV